MPDTAFHIEKADIPDVQEASALTVRGRIRHAEAGAFRSALLQWIGNTPESRLVIELGAVEDMDTSGAAVLVEALVDGRKRGKRVLLCAPSAAVMQLFRLAGFEEALGACCPTRLEARRRMERSA